MLESGDQIEVTQLGGRWDVDADVHLGWLHVDAYPITFVNIPVKTPFTINLAQVEYCKGAINPETNNYELKIRFCSGHELWLGGEAAAGLLEQVDKSIYKREKSPNLAEKFKEKTK